MNCRGENLGFNYVVIIVLNKNMKYLYDISNDFKVISKLGSLKSKTFLSSLHLNIISIW